MQTEIQLSELGFLSSATTAFLNQSDQLTDLIPITHPFFSIENAIKGKKDFPAGHRQILVDTLKAQYARLGITDSELLNQNIASLADATTFTVTTGQQLHLFLGPAFMVYKLISVIKAAEHYETQYPGKRFVPVYWLASEDHDFDEIKNTPLFGQNYEWLTAQSGACGTYHLKDLPALFAQLKQKLEKDAKAMQLLAEFEAIYASSDNLSDATVRLTHHLFGAYGLVCLDANNHALKQLFTPVILDEVKNRKSIQAFDAFSELMAQKDLSLQLKGRDINLFYLKDDIRARIEFKDGQYTAAGTSFVFTPSEIDAEIHHFPERFSPNAVLRPVYQETILPNVAYIGGNAEINYWLQLQTVFQHFAISPSALILRQSAWMIRAKQSEWLDSKSITISSLFKIKTDQDKFDLLNQGTVANPFPKQLEKFTRLKDETLDMAGKDGLKHIRETAESWKLFEKNIRELIKAKNEQLSEAGKKEIIKLEQLMNNGFSRKIIQERTVYSIEFLINRADYIKYCLGHINFKPGTGYFLQL